MQVSDLTVEEFKQLIYETVTETLQDLLIDSDEGKQLRPEVASQLRKSLASTQSGERGVAASAVAQKLGLDWDEL